MKNKNSRTKQVSNAKLKCEKGIHHISLKKDEKLFVYYDSEKQKSDLYNSMSPAYREVCQLMPRPIPDTGTKLTENEFITFLCASIIFFGSLFKLDVVGVADSPAVVAPVMPIVVPAVTVPTHWYDCFKYHPIQ